MSTLTYTHDSVATREARAGRSDRKPIWRRVFDALVSSQQRRAEAEIARYMSRHGGLFTDDMEREIMSRLSGNAKRSV